MRKLIVFLITLVLVAGIFAACGHDTNAAALELPRDAKIQTVSVSSLPEGYSYSFSGDEAIEIIDYLSGLNLIAVFSENPNEYTGMTWVISIEYEDQDGVTVYHFGNLFIRTENGPWYKMDFDEEAEFARLLEKLTK